jgi:GntR family transcriptional repressor for pyruvate dehydrogenase complex
MAESVRTVPGTLRRVRQDSLGTQVVRELRSYIQARGLGVGDRLPTERDLSEALGVSRTTVREAMKSLESVGIVERKPRRGTTLGEVNLSLLSEILRFSMVRSRSDLEDLLAVRRLPEVNMLPMIVANATAEDWLRMEEANRRMETETGDVGTWQHAVEADLAFHRALLTATGNGMLYQFYGMIREFFDEVSMYYSRDRKTLIRSVGEHRRLVEFLKNGDARAAQRVMEEHLGSLSITDDEIRADVPPASHPSDTE